MEGERVFLSPIVRPVERLIYRVAGVDETSEQGWKGYAVSVLVMALVAIVAGYVVFRLQDVLPLNQGGIPAMSPDLAFNTSVSFETNTNWQNYSGESGRHLPDPGGRPRRPQLHVRGDRPRHRDRPVPRPDPTQRRRRIGNYWVDLTRGILYILLPIVDRRRPRPRLAGRAPDLGADADGDDAPGRHAEHRHRSGRLPGVIKELGNNGGGFFNANSAHPFENPTPLTNWLEIFAILLIARSR